MRSANRSIADTDALAGYELGARVAPNPGAQGEMARPPGPIQGFVQRHGETIAFTLDTAQPMPAPQGIVIEQVAIAAIVIASFIAPIYQLMG